MPNELETKVNSSAIIIIPELKSYLENVKTMEDATVYNEKWKEVIDTLKHIILK